MRTLRLGTSGNDVSAWQQFLTDQGFKPGKADGQFGLATEQATIAFQAAQGLSHDGVAGPTTLNAAVALGFKAPQQAPGATDQAIDQISDVPVFQTADGSAIYFTTGMDVDADGAFRAYKANNGGLDFNKNGKDKQGNWVGVLTDGNNQPLIQKETDPQPGYYISTTSLQDITRAKTDPLRYVDAENIPYIVLPGGHLGSAMLGDYAVVINLKNGKRVNAIVADSGPKHKIGEASIAVASALLGANNCSPRSGGTDKGIRYVVFPNTRNASFPVSGSTATIEKSIQAIDNTVAPLLAQAGSQTAFA